MPLDRALRLTVRNFSTLFLVVFIVIIPLHLVYAFFFHDVYWVRELHPAIAQFPENRLVRGVGADDLTRARLWFWILVAVEFALAPAFLRAVKQVLALDEEGGVPDAIGAWRRIREPATPRGATGTGLPTAVASVLIGVLIGTLIWATFASFVDLLPHNATAFGVAVADATSRAAGAAFGLTGLALASATRTRGDVQLRL